MRWWDELWLNEGFANYFEQAVTNLVLPELQILQQHVQYLSRALHFDGSPDTHPVRAQGEVSSDSAVSSLFDAISYDKAGAVIFMLHDFLERRMPGAFVAGLASYVRQNAFGSASGEDMWQQLSSATGLPIDQLIEPWFSQAGYPLIEVTTLSDGSAVVLQTGRFLQDLTRTQMAFDGHAGGDQAEYMSSWWVPISYYSSNSPEVLIGEISSSSAFLSIPPAKKRFGGFDIDGTDWLKLNFNGAGYYRVNYAPHLWARLVQAATEPGHISDADLANLIDDAFALTLDGRLSGVILSLARALGTRTAHESAFITSSYESWQSMSIGLHTLHSLIAGAVLAGSSSAGLIAGPGLELVPRRCVDDLQRFVRTQVIGRCLDPLLAMPPSGVLAGHGAHGASASSLSMGVRTIKSQLEALAPPILLSLASTMRDVRVGVWVLRALQPCFDAPAAECGAIRQIPPDLRFQCLAICASFDVSGRCWQLVRSQLPFAENDPSYRNALLVALARAPTEALLNKTLELTINGTIARPQDLGSMIAMLANNPTVLRARPIVWEAAKARRARLRGCALLPPSLSRTRARACAALHLTPTPPPSPPPAGSARDHLAPHVPPHATGSAPRAAALPGARGHRLDGGRRRRRFWIQLGPVQRGEWLRVRGDGAGRADLPRAQPDAQCARPHHSGRRGQDPLAGDLGRDIRRGYLRRLRVVACLA